jgi:protein O-mannosyl-transferase
MKNKSAARRRAGQKAKANLPKGAGGASQSFWKRDWVSGLLLLFITIIVYQPVWYAGFIWDDDVFLTDNPVLKQADGLYRLWFTASTPDYFPMTSSMLWLEWCLWGNHPLGYHLVNVLLHAFSAVLWWRVLLRLKIPGAWLAAAIFALHPVNVESVAWITERKNTLAMFFYAAVLLSYLKFEDTGNRRWYGFALAGFALALLSKTAVAPLPVVLLGLAWWRRGRVAWQDVRRSVPFFLLAAALALVTIWFQSHQAIGHTVVRTDNFWSRLAGASWAVWFYLYKALLPLNLIFVYPRWQINARNVLSYVPLLLLLAALVLFWRKRQSWGKAGLFGLGYFVLMLLPILGFLDIYFMRFSLVADHWQYFAIIAPIALAAAFIRTRVPAVALLLVLGVLTWNQCRMYADVETLWQDTLKKNPDCWMAQNNLGRALSQERQTGEAIECFKKAIEIEPHNAEAYNNLGYALFQNGEADKAITYLQQALAIKPDFAEVENNLGAVLFQKGEVDEAMTHYQKAVAIQPDFAEAYNNMGNIFLQKGQVDEAIAQYQTAIKFNPDFADACNNLGAAFSQKGKLDEAIVQYQMAIRIEPGNAEAHNNLAGILLQKGEVDAAMAQSREALKIRPDYAKAHKILGVALVQKGQLGEGIAHLQKALMIQPAFVEVQNYLAAIAWVLATSPNPSDRNGTKAVELARQADQSSGGKNPMMTATLAAAYAEAGRFPEAVAAAERALQLASSQNNAALAAALQSQIQLYQSGSPFRDTGKSR